MDPYRRAGEPAGGYALFVRAGPSSLTCIEPGRPHVVGRSPRADVVLPDATALDQHATFTLTDGHIVVRAIGPVTIDAELVDGDAVAKVGSRIGIASVTLVVEAGAAVEAEHAKQARAARKHAMFPVHIGGLEDIPPCDLLLLLGEARRTGVLAITSPADETGTIDLREGFVCGASLPELVGKPLLKCVHRMLGWRDGLFELRGPETGPVTARLPVRDVVVAYQAEEPRHLLRLRLLPDPGTRLVADDPPPGAKPEHVEMLRVVRERAFLHPILDASPLTDFEATRVLVDLLQRGSIRPAHD